MDMNDTVTISLAKDDALTRRVIVDVTQAYGMPISFVETASAISVSGPVRLGSLLQRIRARASGASVAIITLGRFIFDPADSVLIPVEEGDDIVLTEKEVAILSCLAAAEGALISRRDLLTKVWGYAEGVETHTLETHIYRLRQKLEHDPAKPEILLTEEQGYSLVIR